MRTFGENLVPLAQTIEKNDTMESSIMWVNIVDRLILLKFFSFAHNPLHLFSLAQHSLHLSFIRSQNWKKNWKKNVEKFFLKFFFLKKKIFPKFIYKLLLRTFGENLMPLAQQSAPSFFIGSTFAPSFIRSQNWKKKLKFFFWKTKIMKKKYLFFSKFIYKLLLRTFGENLVPLAQTIEKNDTMESSIMWIGQYCG